MSSIKGPFVYHQVPTNMEGHLLYARNDKAAPEAVHALVKSRYTGRETIVDAEWVFYDARDASRDADVKMAMHHGDILYSSTTHPQFIFDGLVAAGKKFETPQVCYEIPYADMIGSKKAVVQITPSNDFLLDLAGPVELWRCRVMPAKERDVEKAIDSEFDPVYRDRMAHNLGWIVAPAVDTYKEAKGVPDRQIEVWQDRIKAGGIPFRWATAHVLTERVGTPLNISDYACYTWNPPT